MLHRVNWYIEDPINIRQADYYLKVFHADLWLSILATIILGGITFTFIQTVLKNFTKNKIYPLAEYALIVFDYFCDQGNTFELSCISI